jgi:hypothetical protein
MNFKDYNWLLICGNIWVVGAVIVGFASTSFLGACVSISMFGWGVTQLIWSSVKIQREYEEQRKNHSRDA